MQVIYTKQIPSNVVTKFSQEMLQAKSDDIASEQPILAG